MGHGPRQHLRKAARPHASGGAGALEALEARTLLSAIAPWEPLPQTAVGEVAVASWRMGGWNPISEWSPTTAAMMVGLDRLRDDPRFDGVDGRAYSIVVIDTGIDGSHPFFGPDFDGDGVADRIAFQYDFHNDQPLALDGHGHGSHVTSIVAAENGEHRGVASGAWIISLKALGDNGSGTFASVERALRWVIENVRTYNIVAVNLSLGDAGNYTTHRELYGIADEIRELAARGVVTAAAAGNNYGTYWSPGLAYPAADPHAIAVGAVITSNVGTLGGGMFEPLPTFTQRTSQLPMVFAPGTMIVGAGAAGSTISMSGTSQATPHVTGAIALAQQLAVRELGRRLGLREVRTILEETGPLVHSGGQTYAFIDLVALAERVLTLAASPIPNQAPSLGIVLETGESGEAFWTISHAAILDRSDAQDADGDFISFRIEEVHGGTLLLRGETVTPGLTVVRAGDSLTWIPGSGTGHGETAFSVRAMDDAGAHSMYAVDVRMSGSGLLGGGGSGGGGGWGGMGGWGWGGSLRTEGSPALLGTAPSALGAPAFLEFGEEAQRERRGTVVGPAPWDVVTLSVDQSQPSSKA